MDSPGLFCLFLCWTGLTAAACIYLVKVVEKETAARLEAERKYSNLYHKLLCWDLVPRTEHDWLRFRLGGEGEPKETPQAQI